MSLLALARLDYNALIPAKAFHLAFDTAFAPAAAAAGLARRGTKWKLIVASHALQLGFPVNRKGAGLSDVPGEFRPEFSWQGGTVSYYQYASEADLAEMQALRRAVVQRVVAQARPNPILASTIDGLDIPLRAQHPDVWLYYFDEHDAAAWGGWFGARIAAWLARFGAAPETLDSWCRRVLWPR